MCFIIRLFLFNHLQKAAVEQELILWEIGENHRFQRKLGLQNHMQYANTLSCPLIKVDW